MNRLVQASWIVITAQWILTTAHHAYAGVVFHTEWRLHGLILGFLAWLIAALLWRNGRQRTSLWVSSVFFGIVIGLFEGGYNHLLKELLYAWGLPQGVLRTLFPPLIYEPPGDLLFEATGVAQCAVGVVLLLLNRVLVQRCIAHRPSSQGDICRPGSEVTAH